MTQFKRNTSNEDIIYKPLTENNQEINFTGATVKFVMMANGQTYINAAGTVFGTSQLVYQFKQEDTLIAGVYNGEFEVLFADGTRRYYPEQGFLRITIEKNLDPAQSTVIGEEIALTVSKVEEFKGEVQRKLDDMQVAVDAMEPANVINLQTEVETARGTAITLDERLSGVDEQLTKTSVTDQVDFVNQLQQLSGIRNVLSVKIEQGGLKQFFVNQKVTPTLGTTYAFRRDGADDYITLMEGSLGTVNELNTVVNTKNNETESGTFTKLNAPNYYTTTIDNWIAATFIGTKISFLSYANNQGGLWEAILNEGKVDEKRVNISVYSATAVPIKEQVLFDNLDPKKHTIKMVFKGDDPANVPSGGAATSRGWYLYGGTRAQDVDRTFNIYGDTFNITKTVDAMYSYSNKEFAISARPAGSTAIFEFVPEHNAVGTAFNLQDTVLLVDGKQVTWKTGNYYNGEVVQLIQKVKGVHTSDTANPMMEIITYHTIKNGVVSVSVKVKVLRDIEIDTGYGLMFPYFVSFAKKIKTSLGNKYTVITDQPNLKEYWVEGDKTQSFAVLNDVDTDDRANVAIAMTVDNFARSTRFGLTGRGAPFSWIEHRGTTIGKIYLQQLKSVTLTAGTQLNFDGRYIVSYLNNANQLIL